MARAREQVERLGDFLTVGEAAEYLGVSASTLRNWDRSGKVKARRHPVNGYRLYSRQDLQKLMAQVKGQKG
ncbi:MAG: MerR family DNA-binding transcriptional regulator [Planctomycetes bacterium]|nr:MerR family DNA-binding transcriptional regulator [Planctomycetota bacterium]